MAQVIVLQLRQAGSLDEELTVFQRLGRHPHLIRLLGVVLVERRAQMLVTELAPGGSLDVVLTRLDEVSDLVLIRQVNLPDKLHCLNEKLWWRRCSSRSSPPPRGARGCYYSLVCVEDAAAAVSHLTGHLTACSLHHTHSLRASMRWQDGLVPADSVRLEATMQLCDAMLHLSDIGIIHR